MYFFRRSIEEAGGGGPGGGGGGPPAAKRRAIGGAFSRYGSTSYLHVSTHGLENCFVTYEVLVQPLLLTPVKFSNHLRDSK